MNGLHRGPTSGGVDLFSGPIQNDYAPANYPRPQAPTGEINTLATLSVVFAFTLPPAGAIIGHLALAQLKQRRQPGRSRALLGLTVSYSLIVLWTVALAVWLTVGVADDVTATTVTRTVTTTSTNVSTSTAVKTPEPVDRPTVTVFDVEQGDCVEIQQMGPSPDHPDADSIRMFAADCTSGNGVFQVTKIVNAITDCGNGMFLTDSEELRVACVAAYDA